MPFTRLFQIGWRIALTILLLLLLLAISVRNSALRAGAQSASDPLVLAFYYTWFDDATWTSGTLSDLPAQRYVSADRAVMGRHIDQAKAAGIDAFIVAWYGPGGSNQTEGNLAALLEEAAARNFRIGILFESDSPFMPGVGEATAGMQHAMAVHTQHPAFLRVDGRPVFFFWRTQRYDIGTWRAIRDQADPNRTALWIADGIDTSYLQLFDGHHLYSNTWNPPANLENVNRKFANQVAAYRQSSGAARLWVATVMPGYDDVRIRPSNGFAQDREGGAYYERSWASALASNPNWIVITSFNEWPEGSYIEPSEAFGDQYLTATAGWSARFKQGGGQPIALAPPSAEFSAAAAPAESAPAATPTPEPVYSTPTLIVQAALLNVRSGPGTDFTLLGTASQGTALPITGRPATESGAEGWWQIDFGGQVGWVSGEFGRAAGPLESVPVVASGSAATSAAPDASAAPEGAMLQTSGIVTTTAGAAASTATPAALWTFAGPRPVLSPRP